MYFKAESTREHVWSDATVSFEEHMVANADPVLPAARAAMEAQLSQYGENDIVLVDITVSATALQLVVRKVPDG